MSDTCIFWRWGSFGDFVNKPSIALFSLFLKSHVSPPSTTMMSLVCAMQVAVSDSRVTGLCWVPVRMRALGAQGCRCCLCFQRGEVIQAERSVDGNCWGDKTGLCFPVILLECVLHCDIGMRMWSSRQVCDTCPTRRREDSQGAMVSSQGNRSHRPCLLTLSPLVPH